MITMWTINITQRESVIYVSASRWGREGPYPTLLFDLELLPTEGESELALLERVGRAINSEAEYLRYRR